MLCGRLASLGYEPTWSVGEPIDGPAVLSVELVEVTEGEPMSLQVLGEMVVMVIGITVIPGGAIEGVAEVGTIGVRSMQAFRGKAGPPAINDTAAHL